MYGIVREHEFDEQAAALVGSVAWCDELLEVVEWTLMRDPYVFPRLQNSVVHWTVTATEPPLLVLYNVDEVHQKVHLRWIEIGVSE